jgi:hypothetical protein
VVPILVILFGAVLATVYGLVAPFAAAGRDLLDELRVQPDLVDVLANPWSLLFLVELALVAPIAEESLKPLAARLVRPRSRREAFLLGAAAERVRRRRGFLYPQGGGTPPTGGSRLRCCAPPGRAPPVRCRTDLVALYERRAA